MWQNANVAGEQVLLVKSAICVSGRNVAARQPIRQAARQAASRRQGRRLVRQPVRQAVPLVEVFSEVII